MAVRRITAEVAGIVSDVLVTVGDAVAADGAVIFIECMKMQLPVISQWGGVVTAIHAAPGDVVEEGKVLVDLEV